MGFAGSGSLTEGIALPKAVEYKPTGKSLTARQAVAESNMTAKEVESIAKWTGNMDYSLFGYKDFLDYALKHTCFRDFLLAGGYIEKVEEAWVSPKIVDWFNFTRNNMGDYQLHELDDDVVGLQNKNGKRWIRPIKVADAAIITKEEFDKICDQKAEFFQKIDELERI